MNKSFLLAWLLIIGVVVGSLYVMNNGSPFQGRVRTLDTNEFHTLVENNQIKSAKITYDANNPAVVTGELAGENKGMYRVNVPSNSQVDEFLRQYGVKEVKVDRSNTFLPQLFWTVLSVVLFVGLFYFLFFRQMRGGGGNNPFSFGKSRARMLNQDKQKITFGDVAGIIEAKEEVQEIIDFLKSPAKFQKLGGHIPKGVLLVGPPGTGKTLLAKAIAGEAGVPFFSISGSDFVEMFVGVGASRVRDMFEQGKKHAPCLIFIDEIDAVGRSRFSGIGGGHDEREQTLNALLVEMDGFETNEGVIIIAATNRPDVLDQALLRPGRFDRQIVIDLPTLDGRVEILKLHAKKIKLDSKVDLRRIARGTPGFSGADLANLINEAALIAARSNKESVGHGDLEEARDKVLWGRERRSHAMSEEERTSTAWHEAGHALAQVLLEHTEPLHKVTIIPRGMALGATMTLPERDVLNKTKSEFCDELVVLMSGRIAEQVHTGEISTGARSDIRVASDIARHMVCDYGMSDAFGMQAFGDNQELLFLGREVNRTQHYSEETARKIDAEVSNLLNTAYHRAHELAHANKDKLAMLVEKLLEVETIDGRDVEDLVKLGRIRTEEERAADAKPADGGKAEAVPPAEASPQPETPQPEPPGPEA